MFLEEQVCCCFFLLFFVVVFCCCLDIYLAGIVCIMIPWFDSLFFRQGFFIRRRVSSSWKTFKEGFEGLFCPRGSNFYLFSFSSILCYVLKKHLFIKQKWGDDFRAATYVDFVGIIAEHSYSSFLLFHSDFIPSFFFFFSSLSKAFPLFLFRRA